MSVTVPEIFAQLPGYFVKGGVDRAMSIYFSIGDDPSGKWTVFLSPDKVEVKPGKAVEDATLVLKTTPDLFIKMVMHGYAPGAMDFMRGKIKSNDPTGLLVLKQAFRFPGA
jgi:hypothetical protein